MLKTFSSPPANTVFAPEWKFHFYETMTSDQKMVAGLRDIILAKEKSIIAEFADVNGAKDSGLGKDSLTSKFRKFNIFKWTEPVVVDFQNFVRAEYSKFIAELDAPTEDVYISCWANVLREGQSIAAHRHSWDQNTYLGGHFAVACSNTSTVYQNPSDFEDIWEFKNEPGKLTFFPAHIVHWTSTHTGSDERITIAFDIVTSQFLEELVIDGHEDFDNYVKF